MRGQGYAWRRGVLVIVEDACAQELIAAHGVGALARAAVRGIEALQNRMWHSDIALRTMEFRSISLMECGATNTESSRPLCGVMSVITICLVSFLLLVLLFAFPLLSFLSNTGTLWGVLCNSAVSYVCLVTRIYITRSGVVKTLCKRSEQMITLGVLSLLFFTFFISFPTRIALPTYRSLINVNNIIKAVGRASFPFRVEFL